MKVGILSTIGNTPLVELTKIFKDWPSRLFVKMEALNPGGSMKDRPATRIIEEAIRTNAISSETVVVESSSGNMGVGLAQACAYYGLRFICVVDPKASPQNIRLLKAYGAEVDFVSEPDKLSGEFLQARLSRVQELLDAIPNSFWPNQYSNSYNAIAHRLTMSEITGTLGDRVDFLFCATSTCGTLRGCAEYVRERGLKTTIVAVDAVGSLIFGGLPAKRLLPGHGASVRPALYQPELANRFVQVTDLECVVGCRLLVQHEAILAGGSSGAVLMAIEHLKNQIPAGSTCVGIFPDRGERYLDTIFSDEWVAEHFGSVSHLWKARDADSYTCTLATT